MSNDLLCAVRTRSVDVNTNIVIPRDVFLITLVFLFYPLDPTVHPAAVIGLLMSLCEYNTRRLERREPGQLLETYRKSDLFGSFVQFKPVFGMMHLALSGYAGYGMSAVAHHAGHSYSFVYDMPVFDVITSLLALLNPQFILLRSTVYLLSYIVPVTIHPYYWVALNSRLCNPCRWSAMNTVGAN